VESLCSGKSDRSGPGGRYGGSPHRQNALAFRPPPAEDRENDPADGSSAVGAAPPQPPPPPRPGNAPRHRHRSRDHQHCSPSRDDRYRTGTDREHSDDVGDPKTGTGLYCYLQYGVVVKG